MPRKTKVTSPTIEEQNNTVKLHKFIANCGVASRRKAEQLILAGDVKLNNVVITNVAERIDPSNVTVTVRNKPLRPMETSLAFALYKPKGCICTASDPQGRVTISEYFPKVKANLYTVGRLDFNTEGLIVVTNNGALTNAIIHPSRHVWKTYLVKVKGVLDKEKLKSIDKRPVIDNIKRQKVGIKLIHVVNDKTWLEVRLQEGVNRQIKKMFANEGFNVLKIKRISIGPITLGDMEPGEHRLLTKEEVDSFLVSQ